MQKWIVLGLMCSLSLGIYAEDYNCTQCKQYAPEYDQPTSICDNQCF